VIKHHLLILTAVICSLLNCRAYGQTANVGIYGGLNFARAHHLYDVSTLTRTGEVFGGFLEIVPSRSLISYQAEIHFIQKGATLDSAHAKVLKWRFSYIELPLLLRTTAHALGLKPFLFVGPKIGLLLTATAMEKTGNQSNRYNEKRATRPVEVSVDGGIGIELEIQSAWVAFASLRYSLGLTDIDKSSGVWTSRDTQLILGTKFSLK
jgi:hypothetical protein